MKSNLAILCIIIPFLTACTTSEQNKAGDDVNTTSPRETGWELAKEMILEGKVETLTQFHDLKVILELKDGGQVITTEPALDDIVKVLEQCGAKCSDTSIISE